MGSEHYTTHVDLWAAGLVLAEMYLLRTVFRSENNLDQLTEIIRLLGSPTKIEIKYGNPALESTAFNFA